jgi:hypothetical protein
VGIRTDDIIALFAHPSHIAFGANFARELTNCGSSIRVHELLIKYGGQAASIMWRTGMTETQVVQAQIDSPIVKPKKLKIDRPIVKPKKLKRHPRKKQKR